MGLFSKTDEINELIDNMNCLETNKDKLKEYREIFNNDEVYKVILSSGVNDYYSIIDNIENIYKFYIDYITTNNNSDNFIKVFNLIKKHLWSFKYYSLVSNSFSDKKIFTEIVFSIIKTIDDEAIFDINHFDESDNMNKLFNYLAKARQYFMDDRALISSFTDLLNKPGLRDTLISDEIKIDKYILSKLKEDKKQNGIYDIDRGTLSELDHKLDLIESSSSNLKILLDTATSCIQELKLELSKSKDELIELKMKELDELSSKARQIVQEFNTTYLELLTKERESLSSEKIELFNELDRELEKKKLELNNIIGDIGSRISVQLTRVNTATNESVRKIEDFVNNNEKIKELISEVKTNDEFLKGLQVISKNIETQEEKKPELIIPEIILPKEERVVDNNINYYFDTSIPFSKRFARFKEEVEKDIAINGAIYHEKFEDIAKLVMLGQVPYMYGPSGCGKTYMIENQLAKRLGMNVVTNGYVLYEQDIIGYTNSATGAYVPGNFYRCYKFGDIIFLDELDNGIANATVVLNRFLGINNKTYTFPDGINTSRHPNFRIISAGNTNGNGRTLAHNTRQKMDESVMQRLTPVEVNYDNRVEREILKDHLDWYYFAINFRKAIESIPGSGDEINTIGTFTTRDAETVKRSLDEKVFDNNQLLDYQIIQTKDIDTLTRLSRKMNELESAGEFKNNSIKILRLFNKKVEEKRSNQ